LKPVFVVDPVL